MRSFNRYIYPVVLLIILIFSLTTALYGPLVIALNITLLLMILNKMGKGIVLRESTAMLYAITCTLMPLVGYNYYTSTNYMARLWVKYMPVKEHIYFEFALPAIVGFCFMLTLPIGWEAPKDEGSEVRNTIERIKQIVKDKKSVGLQIILVGLVVGGIVSYLPGGLQFFATLFFFGSFAGLLYVYYTPYFRYKKLLITAFVGFIVFNALGSGMFTIVAYMGVTISSFFLLANTTSLLKKAIIVIFAVAFIIVLQNTKEEYRKKTWKSNYDGSKIELFGKLFIQNFQKGNLLIENKPFFAIYSRTNQGFNVALVMRRFPAYQKHDYGSNLLKAFASAFVPRFLWPDKPEAGGRFNMKYYAGYNLRGWSTNIGPLGEAYGSFGITGGIIYMMVLGAFIRWAYQKVFSMAKKIPLLICWLPVLFFQITYSAEADSLQIMNSLIKATVFIWILYKFLPKWFGKTKGDTPQYKSVETPSYNI